MRPSAAARHVAARGVAPHEGRARRRRLPVGLPSGGGAHARRRSSSSASRRCSYHVALLLCCSSALFLHPASIAGLVVLLPFEWSPALRAIVVAVLRRRLWRPLAWALCLAVLGAYVHAAAVLPAWRGQRRRAVDTLAACVGAWSSSPRRSRRGRGPPPPTPPAPTRPRLEARASCSTSRTLRASASSRWG